MAKGWHGDSAGHARAARKRKYNKVAKRGSGVSNLRSLMLKLSLPKATNKNVFMAKWKYSMKTKWKPYKYK